MAPRPQTRADIVTMIVLFVVAFVLTLWGWLLYFGSSVRTDEYTFEKRTPFSRRKLEWHQVRALSRKPSYPGKTFVVQGENATIRFSELAADADELCVEIARRSGLSWREDG